MTDILKLLSRLIPFLSHYPLWVQGIFCVWLLLGAVILVLLLIYYQKPSDQTASEKSPPIQQSTTVQNTPNSTISINQAGRDINIHSSGPPPPIYTGELTSTDVATSPKVQIGNGGLVFRTKDKNGVFFTFPTGAYFGVVLEGGLLKVSTIIYDRTLKRIAELSKNEWQVAPPPGIWDRNYSDDAVEIIDDRGDVVLQVRLVNGCAQLQAIYYAAPDIGYAFLRDPKSPIGESHVLVFGPGFPLWEKIEPIFRYPGNRHLGELLNPRLAGASTPVPSPSSPCTMVDQPTYSFLLDKPLPFPLPQPPFALKNEQLHS
jgi:hypothetical protein